MLFYPQKELLNERNFRYKIVGLSLLFHLFIFLTSLCINKLKNKQNVIKLNLEALSKNAIISFGTYYTLKKPGTVNCKANSVYQNNTYKTKPNSKPVTKKEPKKVKEKTTILDQSTKKRSLLDKEQDKKPKKTPKTKMQKNPEKVEKKILDSPKPLENKKDVTKKDNIDLNNNTNNIENSQTELIKQEEAIMTLDNFDDIQICNEIKKNLEIPPGFLLEEPLKITVQIGPDGNVQNISERQSEPIAIYIALKKALIKSKYPKKKWGTNFELIIQ